MSGGMVDKIKFWDLINLTFGGSILRRVVVQQDCDLLWDQRERQMFQFLVHFVDFAVMVNSEENCFQQNPAKIETFGSRNEQSKGLNPSAGQCAPHVARLS